MFELLEPRRGRVNAPSRVQSFRLNSSVDEEGFNALWKAPLSLTNARVFVKMDFMKSIAAFHPVV